MKLFANWYLNSWSERVSVECILSLEKKTNYQTNEIKKLKASLCARQSVWRKPKDLHS